MLEKFFIPKSIAIIGASPNKKKLGYGLVENLIKAGFRGKIYPVNLTAKRILRLKVFSNVLNIKNRIDLAIIAIPAPLVPMALKECGQKKIKNVIIISAGFKEIGTKGLELENQLKKTAKRYKIKILGPNCLGILSSDDKLNASFAKGMIKKGKIAFVSQSGAICTSLLDWANAHQIGFSKFISLGNKTVLTEIDFLNYFKNDKNTKVILAYLEDVAKPREFLQIASKIAQIKPIFVLKPGSSKKAQEAISSHTGAMAQEEKIIKAAFKQAGIVQLNNLQQLFGLTKFYNYYDGLKGPNIAIVTNAGGPSVITVDDAEISGLVVKSLSQKTQENLRKTLPPSANVKNPIDVIGDADAKRYEVALNNVAVDPNINAIIVILTPQTTTEVKKTAEIIIKIAKKKSVLVSFIGGQTIDYGKKLLTKKGIPFFDFPNQAVNVLANVWQAELAKLKAINFSKIDKQIKISPYLVKKTKQIDFLTAAKTLKKYQLPVIKTIEVTSASDAQKQAHLIGLPVVLKINSERIIHKTEMGAVITKLITDHEIKKAFIKLKAKIRQNEKIVMQPQPGGIELILGFKRDVEFGPIFIFGLGGIYTEILKDVAFRINPLNKTEVLSMIKETKVYKLLTGYRNYIKADINYLVDLIYKIVKLANEKPDIMEFEINPLIINNNSAKIVDVRILTKNNL